MEVADLEDVKLAFGPVPSKRLGRSLGVDNIPAKTCSYSCVYCQVGKTINMTTDRHHADVGTDTSRMVVEKSYQSVNDSHSNSN